MWPFKRSKKQETVNGTGLAEAQAERRAAEKRLEVTQREVTIPLREMHRENHIRPRLNALIQRRADEEQAHG